MRLVPRRRRLLWALVAAVLLGVVGFVGVPYVYVHFVNDPAPPLSFEQLDEERATSTADTTTGDVVSLDGTWTVVAPSTAGYRVGEVLNGQRTEAVGRTTSVDGTVALRGTTVEAAEISVDLTTITSGSARRDARFRGPIMETDQFPVAIFTLDQPIELGPLPGDDVPVKVTAKGTLSLHGVDRSVDVPITSRRQGERIQLTGSIPVVFADHAIANPSFGPVSTDDRGLLEFAITLSR